MRFALALILLFAGQTDPVSRSWNQPVAPFHIIGNVWYVGASDITSYLITTPKGHILIDGGFAETAPMIRRNIELGFRVSDVPILLSSHAHFLASHGNFYDLAGKMKRREGKKNPFIDREGYRAFIERAAARMEKVVVEQQK